MVSSMIEYYKDDLQTTGKENKLDEFTRYEFSFSGLECRILGTFYKDEEGNCVFGADVENFYSSHNYNVYKPMGDTLEYIVNLRDDNSSINHNKFKVGKVRYSSSLRFQENQTAVSVYINPKDFLGKRTAFFGMTRTGKSNTVKKIIQSTVDLSDKAKGKLNEKTEKEEVFSSFTEEGVPKYPVGQIIFDINGEYANANLQDEGTAIFELYKKRVIRYSVLEKEGFKVMKVNFYNDTESGFELVRSYLDSESSDYVNSFKTINLSKPEDTTDRSKMVRYERRRAAYLCCLYRAGFKAPKDFKVKFDGNATLNTLVRADGKINPKKGISLKDATEWFKTIWENYNSSEFINNYKKEKGHEWADEDLKAILIFLTGKKQGSKSVNLSGYKKLAPIKEQHTPKLDEPFQKEIIKNLRKGNIIIVDLSQGNPEIQTLYSDIICQHIFQDSLNNFIKNEPNNFIQIYFEEAHNLFPKKESSNLSQTYNRIAKEGAKLNLGLLYATQEVSSISANILKNTQNWFISHLNNKEEIHELKKYYDFADFADSLMRFSANTDKGFVRMKTYSNPFVVPVQIDRFTVKEEE